MRMIDLDDRSKLMDAITKFHVSSRPERYKHFGQNIGGMNGDGHWLYEAMLKVSIEELRLCLKLLIDHHSWRSTFEDGRNNKQNFAEWFSRQTHRIICAKLAGLIVHLKCGQCFFEQNLYAGKTIDGSAQCMYCGADLTVSEAAVEQVSAN